MYSHTPTIAIAVACSTMILLASSGPHVHQSPCFSAGTQDHTAPGSKSGTPSRGTFLSDNNYCQTACAESVEVPAKSFFCRGDKVPGSARYISRTRGARFGKLCADPTAGSELACTACRIQKSRVLVIHLSRAARSASGTRYRHGVALGSIVTSCTKRELLSNSLQIKHTDSPRSGS